VYIDETGFDEYYSRNYGYSKRGHKIIGKVYGRKIFRTNLVAGLANGKVVAEKLYKESTDYSFFEDWFTSELLPQIKKKTVIILDNATFHRKVPYLVSSPVLSGPKSYREKMVKYKEVS